jgi:hypothetical protein
MTPKNLENTPGRETNDAAETSARDREMGRDAAPAGDLGHGQRTWSPPPHEQGISNRPGDGHEGDGRTVDASRHTSLDDPPDAGVPSQQGIRGHAQDERPDDEKKTRDRGGRS